MRRSLSSSVLLVVLVATLGCGGGNSSDTGTGTPDVPSPGDGIAPDGLADPGPRLDTPPADGSTDGVGDLPNVDGIVSDVTGDLPVLDIPAQPGCPVCGRGILTGLACAPDGKSIVPDVTVSIDGTDCHGQPFHKETTSDSLGRYTLEDVPCGYQAVNLNKGSYSHDFSVFVTAGETTEAKTGRCFEGTAAKIAVITGDWDAIEGILDMLKLKYTLIDGIADDSGSGSEAGNFLSDWSELSKYNVLFINCGKSLETGPSGIANLQKWVKGGGSLYASDYAVSYINAAWPNALEMPANIYSVWAQTVNASIRDPRLVGYLGKDWIKISYVLGPLVMVDAAGPDTEVHIEGIFPKYEADQDVHPQMLSFRPYGDTGGRVVYANFHHEEQTAEPGKTDVRQILKFIVFML